jgi:uncharacterized membrane protein YjjB (DUF3815 family)
VYLAWIGEQVGARFLGSHLGGLVGAALITLVAYVAEAVAAAPPSRVMFLPAFWLLVPGALAVIGVAELVGNELEVALLDLSATAFTIVAIALGVLIGILLARGYLSVSRPN